jgi:hypothetical protein
MVVNRESRPDLPIFVMYNMRPIIPTIINFKTFAGNYVVAFVGCTDAGVPAPVTTT